MRCFIVTTIQVVDKLSPNLVEYVARRTSAPCPRADLARAVRRRPSGNRRGSKGLGAGLHALIERLAAALQQALEQPLHTLRVLDSPRDVGKLAPRHRLPTCRRRSSPLEPGDQHARLGHGEAGLLRQLHECNRREHAVVIDPPATGALRGRDQARLLVVPQRRHTKASALRDRTDGKPRLVWNRLVFHTLPRRLPRRTAGQAGSSTSYLDLNRA